MSLNALSGAIIPSIFNISTMVMMDLSQNHFTGNLSSTTGLSLPSLRELYLGTNQLSGEIPSSIVNATNLTIIFLGVNSFAGTVPDFSNLRLLRCLLIGGNNLTGSLSLFTSCRSLEFLEISENPLHAILPASIGNLSNSLEVSEHSNAELQVRFLVRLGT